MKRLIGTAPEKGKIEHNQRGSLRIIDHKDKANLRAGTYTNDFKRRHRTRINACMNGMEDLNDLVHLQVIGESQISKELQEMYGVKQKVFDMEALHRNEITKSIEPENGYPEDDV